MVQFCEDSVTYEDIVIKRCKGTITTVSHKGGCGKTTFAYILASYCFEKLHEKVLLIDFDQQGSAGERFGVIGDDAANVGHRTSELFDKNKSPVPYIKVEDKQYGDAGIHILLGDINLKDCVENAERTLEGKGGVQVLSKMLSERHSNFEQNYDRIIFDTPPTIDKSKGCIYALNVTDRAIVTLTELESVEQFEKTVKIVVQHGIKKPVITPLFTMYTKDEAKFPYQFDTECAKKNLKLCGPIVRSKCSSKGFGYDERRSTLYRMFRSMYPQSSCNVAIPRSKNIERHKYAGVTEENSRILDAVCREVLSKVRINSEDLFNSRIFNTKMALLREYIKVIHYIDTVGLNIKNKSAKLETNIVRKKVVKSVFDKEGAARRRDQDRDAWRNR